MIGVEYGCRSIKELWLDQEVRLFLLWVLEHSLIECHNTRARVNADDQSVIDFSVASDWLGKWREFSGPITEQKKKNQWNPRLLVGHRNYFGFWFYDTQLTKGSN